MKIPSCLTEWPMRCCFLQIRELKFYDLMLLLSSGKKWEQIVKIFPKHILIIQAFNAVMKIVAPSFLFKSEAIVHPDEVNKYISEDECQLSYNPQMMALSVGITCYKKDYSSA